MKSILCCALLILPSAHGTPRKSTTPVPPKAKIVAVQPTKTKASFNTSGRNPVPKAKVVQAAAPKVVAVRPDPPSNWFFTPRFRKTGKDDTTWGLLVNRRF